LHSRLPNLRRSLLPLVLVSALILASQMASAAGKPRVAIKTPKLGDEVEGSHAARNHLDLGLLTADMEASIRATRKFDIVSRQKDVMKDIREEQQLSDSDAFAGDAAGSGALANANYLILPTVQRFSFYRSAKAVPNLDNKWKITDAGVLHVTAQLVDTTTGQVLSTFDTTSSFKLKTRLANTDTGSPTKSNFARLSKNSSAQMADQLVDSVFPMKVINAQGNQVWINRGQDGGLEVGDTLTVFSPGVALIDPDTGENLGSAESEVGTIKVTRVNPKFTIAELLDISPNTSVEKGFIIRK